MAELQTPTNPDSASARVEARTSPERRRKRRKLVRTLLTLLLVLAILGAAGWVLWKFVFAKDDKNLAEPIYDTAFLGSISTTVRGGGSANAKASESIVFTADGVVQELYVTQGQMVNAGDPLYYATSPAAEEALAAAREALSAANESAAAIQREIDEIEKTRRYLTITAPHDGKLTEVTELRPGSALYGGGRIARLVDDTKLKLSLYYSYAYENDIRVGQHAAVSVPAVMTTLDGTVEKINKVDRITPEGGRTFEVILVVDNPGTMTEGMAAGAEMTDAEGYPIYPYENGTFSYYQTTEIAARLDGAVEWTAELLNYARVTAGQTLVVQSSEGIDAEIRMKRDSLAAAREVCREAQARVEEQALGVQNFSAVASISGTVISCSLYEGQEVTAGTTALTIADNAVMTVNINVDDRNRQYISEGMPIELSDWYGNTYFGEVESVAVVGTYENGVTVFPAVIRVDNPTGTLMGGYYLDYSFTAAESLDCVLVPIQDVRYFSPDGADAPQGVVYLRQEEGMAPPEATIEKTDLPEEMQQEIPADCVVVPVETGLSDNMNVEILSGVREGDVIYNNTPSADGSYWG